MPKLATGAWNPQSAMTIVHLPHGELRGSTDDGIHSFKGVPYAEPLTGAARWLPPQPRRPWNELRDARSYGPVCMQFAGAGTPLPFPRARRRYFDAIRGEGNEVEGDDCLLLNVWTPTLEKSAKLPVMVWIHGGGFTAGAALEFYDATPFARRDVVAVALQYRLGPLGFLHGAGLFEGELCGDNRGLLDIRCALQWVQDHIESFGGDAGNVTLFGESAGAFAIYQLAASPQARGLFHRAIALGGMAQTCAPADEYHAVARDALKDVGVAAGDTQALLALDRAKLQKLQASLTNRVFRSRDPDQYGSLTRLQVGFMGAATGTDFLPQAPLDNYRRGTPNNIDLMLGTCANDGGLFSLVLPLGASLSARLFSRHFAGMVPNRDLKAMHARYRPLMNGSAGRVVEQVNNDAFYRMPTIRAAEAHAAGHPGKTWHYQLDYRSTVPGLGAIHGIDVALLFSSSRVNGLIADDAETLRLSQLMRDAMTAFARTGTPAAKGLPAWVPYDETTRSTLVFDRACRMEADLDGNFRRCWQ